jgi:hypothetical protein|tara:strand:+ start:458 stop:676 length:219 start_codon:yes stop_codon:yes gene_type:complete
MTMSNKKIKFTVEIYETVTETHEIIVDKETYDKLGNDFSLFDYISEDTLVDKEWGDNTDYEITESEEINDVG